MNPPPLHSSKSTIDKQAPPANKNIEQNQQQEIELEETTEVKLKFVYLEKEVEIYRPVNYSSRGFGFLLNTGLNANEDFVNSELYLLVYPENNDSVNVNNAISTDTFVERLFVYENFAQIVVVEPG